MRFNDSTRMEKHNAIKKTAFTKAPKTSALCQPKVFLSVRWLRLEYRKAKNPITSDMMSDNMWNESATSAIEFVA